MKIKILLFSLLLFPLSFILFPAVAQIPQGFNYQAIARDGSGNPIVNATINVRLSILSDSNGFYPSGGGTYVWEETHSSVKTNAYGLFTIVEGNPLAIKSQGTALSFSAIDWTKGPLYIGTKIANPSPYKALGAAQLLTVPYAMVAGNLTGTVTKLNVAGSDTSMTNALFEVKNNTGQTVFAVYNEGVRIYVDNGTAKGLKGGFAIGGFGSGKGASQPLFVVNSDSIRAYIDTNPIVKGLKGGFAIGSFSPAKAPGEEYLRVTRDSTRVNVHQPAKGLKGGFAIGGFSGAKGASNNFMEMTPDNYFIGDSSGAKLTSGLYNSFIGFKTGVNNSSGADNVFIGYQGGYKNTTGNSNLFIGYQSGFNNITGNYNSFVGYMAGYNNTTGLNNTFTGSYSGTNNTIGGNNSFFGFYSGFSNVNGNNNNFIGFNSGYSNTVGTSNVFIGPNSGYYNVQGDSNIFVGVKAGLRNTYGKDNVLLGAHSGLNLQTGNNNICVGVESGLQSVSTSDNIFIGYKAGYYGYPPNGFQSNVGNGNVWIGKNAGYNMGYLWTDQFNISNPSRPLENTLVIDNNDGTGFFYGYTPQHYPAGDQNKYPLIFGNFSYEAGRRGVVINGVYNYTYTFFVNGAAGGKTSWANVSDGRQKTNINEIKDALNKIIALRGVNFEWIDTINYEKGIQMGFIAQEAEKVIPEVVLNRGGSYSMYYAPITALLVEGIKEQQKIIDNQKLAIEDQEKRIQSLQSRIEQIEAILSKSGER